MLWVFLARVGLLIDRNQPHETHQAARTVATARVDLPLQKPCHLLYHRLCAIPRLFQELLVNNLPEPQVLCACAHGLIIQGSTVPASAAYIGGAHSAYDPCSPFFASRPQELTRGIGPKNPLCHQPPNLRVQLPYLSSADPLARDLSHAAGRLMSCCPRPHACTC